MRCWCGGYTIKSFHEDYEQCTFCGSFVCKEQTPENFYDFQTYWHDRQINKYGFPAIEERAKADFFNRIPYWWDIMKNFHVHSVLEIGCGHGGFLHYCKKQGVQRCLGVEVSEDTCDFARKTFDLPILCGTFPNVPIQDTFDFVCSFDVLEHLPNPELSLQEMSKLGKYVMIQTPCYRKEGKSFPHFNKEEHLFIFTEESIKILFDNAGLNIITSCRGAFHHDITIIGEKL